MESKIAVITGGGSGLGLAITEKFVQKGIRTIIIGRDEQKLAEAQKALGDLLQYKVFDITNLMGILALVADIIREYGRIDILVNNAGIHLKKPMLEVTDEEFLRVINTNLVAVFSMSREIAKIMVEQRAGNILNISSMAAYYGISQVIAYTAAKSGIEGMTRAMAVELSPLGVRVNCIAPGFIETKMSGKALNNDPERKNKVLSRTPMAKLGKPSDIGDAAYFLVSEEAAFVTGASFPVDGGNSIGF